MARLPVPGADDNSWGQVLNDFLGAVHKSDGTLKDNIVPPASLQTGIPGSLISDGTISEAKLDSALQTKVNSGGGAAALSDLTDVDTTGSTDGQSLVYQSGTWGPATVTGGGGVTDHGALTGLTDDDHPQYLNNTRGDVRYYTKAQVDTSLTGKVNTSAVGAINGVASLDGSGKVPTSQLPATGGGAVDSVNGQTGVVVLDAGDIAGFAAVATSGAYADLSGRPAAAIPLTTQATWPIVPPQSTATVDYNTGSSSYPPRPTSRTDVIVRWRGPVAPSVGGSGAVDNVDEWVNTP